MSRTALLLLAAICVACKPDAPAPAPAADGKPAAAGPQMQATVVTIRTALQPENRTHTRTLVIANDRARDTGEQDTWRLYDTKADTVTFVDDIAKTVRTEPLKSILQKRRAATAAALPPHYPRVRLVRPGTKKQLQGVSAEAVAIETGTYKRELWIAEHPDIPRGLFAMMHASEPQTSPLAPMMRAVDEALLTTRGFPLADRAAVGNVVVDRSVISIAKQAMPEALLAIPNGYRDLTPKAKAKR
jgi:hypothetical protein